MPFEQLLQAAVPEWDIDVGWPDTRSGGTVIGSDVTATDINGLTYFDGYPANKDFGILPTGGAGFRRPDWADVNGVVCMKTDGAAFPSAYYIANVANVLGPLLATDINFSMPEPFRVYILELYVCWDTAAPTIAVDDKPLLYVPSDGGSVTNIDTSGIAGAQYGIRGDGAGGFEFYSAIGGVLQENTAITWPEADLRNWVKVGMQHKVANASRAATLDILINDAAVLSRTWEAGTNLPDFSDAVAGTGCMMRAQFRQGVNANRMNIAQIRCRQGRFDVAGTEVA